MQAIVREDGIELHTYYKPVDDRRNKVYGKNCRVEIYVPQIEMSCNTPGPSAYAVFCKAVEALCPGGKVADSYGRRDTWTVYWETVVVAKKPSSICPDEVARAKLLDDEALIGLVEIALLKAKLLVEEQVATHKMYMQAASLLEWYRREVEKKAKEVMRFGQKLAALCAEFVAEVDVQAEALLHEAKVAALSSEDLHTPGVQAGTEKFLELAVAYVKENKGDGLPGAFPHVGSELEQIAKGLREHDAEKAHAPER